MPILGFKHNGLKEPQTLAGPKRHISRNDPVRLPSDQTDGYGNHFQILTSTTPGLRRRHMSLNPIPRFKTRHLILVEP